MIVEREGICPWCGYRHTCASGIEHDDPPGPGDVTICIQCGRCCFFTEDALRKPTKAPRSPPIPTAGGSRRPGA